MDAQCADCHSPIRQGPRCRSCAAVRRWEIHRQTQPKLPPRYCKWCGVRLEGQQQTRTYCTRQCCDADPASRPGRKQNRVEKVCKGCRKTFAIPVSNADRYTYCTRECSRLHAGQDLDCEACGKTFRTGRAGVKRRHCSEACRRPAVFVVCLCCGKRRRVTPSRSVTARYCSRRCYLASGAETSIEARVRETLESLGATFTAQASVGRWVVDFLLDDLVIEADGDYWHSRRPSADARKTSALEEAGYTVWRFPESEIVQPGFPQRLGDLVTKWSSC